jgi:hypothetical protein
MITNKGSFLFFFGLIVHRLATTALLLVLIGSLIRTKGVNANDFLEKMGCERLLEDGVCMAKGYIRNKVPDKGKTQIKVSFLRQEVRSLHDKDRSISIDFEIAFRWIDPRIKSNFSTQDMENGGVGLDLKSVFFEIWKPDAYIYRLKDYKVIWSDQIRLASLKVVSTNPENNTENCVEWKVEASTQIHCSLQLQNYPMDNQTCEFRIGSQSPNYKFFLYDLDGSYHKSYQGENGDYVMDITFFDEDKDAKLNEKGLGFKIEISRKIKSYLLRYYLTSGAIVLASQVSFIIPIDIIPGRIGLIVTLFLTLTNIFIAQMVSKFGFLWLYTITLFHPRDLFY